MCATAEWHHYGENDADSTGHRTVESQSHAEDRWWQGVEHMMESNHGGKDTAEGIGYEQDEWRGNPLVGFDDQGIWSDCES